MSPSMADTRDDFPLPTLPTTATSLPSGTDKLILAKQNEYRGRVNKIPTFSSDCQFFHPVFGLLQKRYKFVDLKFGL